MQRQAVEGEQTKTGMQKETVGLQCWAGNSVVRRMARAERTQPPEVCSSQLPGPFNQSNHDVVVSSLNCSLAPAPPRRQRPARREVRNVGSGGAGVRGGVALSAGCGALSDAQAGHLPA